MEECEVILHIKIKPRISNSCSPEKEWEILISGRHEISEFSSDGSEIQNERSGNACTTLYGLQWKGIYTFSKCCRLDWNLATGVLKSDKSNYCISETFQA